MRKFLSVTALLISLVGCYKFTESVDVASHNTIKTVIVDSADPCCPDVPQSK